MLYQGSIDEWLRKGKQLKDFGSYAHEMVRIHPGQRVVPSIADERQRIAQMLSGQQFRDAGFVLIPIEGVEDNVPRPSNLLKTVTARSKFGPAMLEEVTWVNRESGLSSTYVASLIMPGLEADELLAAELRQD